MDWTIRLMQVPDLEITAVVDGFVVQRPGEDRLHFLNPTAAFILESCDGNVRSGELPELVAAAFELDQAPLEDVANCLAALLREGLLIMSPAAATE